VDRQPFQTNSLKKNQYNKNIKYRIQNTSYCSHFFFKDYIYSTLLIKQTKENFIKFEMFYFIIYFNFRKIYTIT
jgi:hypothetical protein